jgi:hypothetical protein
MQLLSTAFDTAHLSKQKEKKFDVYQKMTLLAARDVTIPSNTNTTQYYMVLVFVVLVLLHP